MLCMYVCHVMYVCTVYLLLHLELKGSVRENDDDFDPDHVAR